MNLLIFSGGGDPLGNQYKPVYDIIVYEAKRRGFKEIKIANWPGHFSFPLKESMSFEKAIPYAIESINEFEKKSDEYVLVARSFGCFVFLMVCNFLKLENVKYAILWGPSPYSTTYWELFKQNINKTISESIIKEVLIDKSFFEGTVPIEYLLNSFKQNFTLRITSGTEDKYCRPYYLKYLQEYIKDKIPDSKIDIYPPVEGAPHEVERTDLSYIEEYYKALFKV